MHLCVIVITPSSQTVCVPLLCTVLDLMPQKLIKINGDKEAEAKMEKL